MPNTSFKDFVMDQLRGIPDLRAKAMFGGYGLYSGKNFFGILHDGRLYFKVDDASRQAYLDRNMSPFTYEQRGRVMTMQYYEAPPDVLEDASQLIQWANRALHVV
jgi:DNA transformation protein and related proteins